MTFCVREGDDTGIDPLVFPDSIHTRRIRSPKTSMSPKAEISPSADASTTGIQTGDDIKNYSVSVPIVINPQVLNGLQNVSHMGSILSGETLGLTGKWNVIMTGVVQNCAVNLCQKLFCESTFKLAQVLHGKGIYLCL